MIREPDLPYKDDREFRIETPVGTVVSDSGNHFVDIISVVSVILVIYLFRVIIRRIDGRK